MNIKLLISFLLLICTFWCKGQIFESSGNDRFVDVLKLSDGNILVCGISSSYGAGAADFTLMKTDADQNILWFKTYGTVAEEGGYSPAICEDSQGNIILVGFSEFQNTSYYGSVLKLDSDGNVLWGRIAIDRCHLRDCVVDQFDNIIVTGTSDMVTHGGDDGLVCKFSPSGTLLWSMVVGGSQNENFTNVTLNGEEIRASGLTRSYGDELRNMFEIKVSLEGEWLDTQVISSSQHENINHSIIDSDGNIIDVGYIEINGDFRTLVVKRNQEDEIVFAKCLHSDGDEWRGGHIVQVGSDYFLTSRVIDSSNELIVVTKLDEMGNHFWSKGLDAIGNHLFDYWAGNIIFDTQNQNLIIPGYTWEGNSDNGSLFSYGINQLNDNCENEWDPIILNVSLSQSGGVSTELELTFENISFSQTDIPFEDEILITSICETEFACDLLVDISMEVPCFSDVLTALPEIANGSDDMSFTWRLNQEVIGTIEELEYEMNSSGSFELSLTVTDNLNNCTAESSVGFNVSPDILVEPLNDISACQEAAATINPIAFGYDSFQWSDGETSLNRTLSTAGVYSITFTNNCEAVTETFTVEFLENPFLDLESNYILCENESIELQISSELDIFLNGELVSSSLEMAEAGEFLLTAAGSCNFSHEFTVEIAEQMSLELPTLLSICEGEAVSITPVAENYDSFQWSDGFQSMERSLSEEGTYSLTISNGCETLTSVVVVEILENPFSSFENQYSFCQGEDLEISQMGVAEIYYNEEAITWPETFSTEGLYTLVSAGPCGFSHNFSVIQVEFPEIEVPEFSQQDICEIINFSTWPGAENYTSSSYNSETEYLELEISNECHTETWSTMIPRDSCELCESEMFIPSAFTPNQDNLNEVFKPQFECEHTLTSYRFEVYNRWGEKIFETTTFSEGWKGNVKGGNYYAQNGVYVWQLVYDYENIGQSRQTVSGRGTVSLIR